MGDDRFDYDSMGNLDDVVVKNVEMFRLEYMDENIVWIRCYCEGKPDVVINLSSVTKIKAFHEFDISKPAMKGKDDEVN